MAHPWFLEELPEGALGFNAALVEEQAADPPRYGYGYGGGPPGEEGGGHGGVDGSDGEGEAQALMVMALVAVIPL